MACNEPEWNNLPETEFFGVWRIENFAVAKWEDIGYFYTGDSFIVLNAYRVGRSQRISRDIYFWLGRESTQDEMGTAAIKTVELDDRFGGEPTQHREVQDHESQEFISLFEKYGGLHYLNGGIASGFKKVQIDDRVSLFHIKGKKKPVMHQVPACGASLNQGDAFLLITPKKINCWIGKTANMMEKNKAGCAFSAAKSRLPKHQYERLDDGETTDEFWEALGGKCQIAELAAEEDDEFEKDNKKELYNIIRNGDSFQLLCEGDAVTKEKITSSHLSLIRKGASIVVFCGKGVQYDVAKKSIDFALNFMKQKNLPNYLSISTAKLGTPSNALDLILA